MSNLRINIRFIFWHLQLERGCWMPRVVFNHHAWKNKARAMKRTVEIYELDFSK